MKGDVAGAVGAGIAVIEPAVGTGSCIDFQTGGVVLVVCSVTVAVLAGVMLGDAFFIYFPLPVLACCAILPMAGYILGYFFAFIARENPKCR